MITLFVLLIVYQLKHFLADYPLQGEYMLGKFKDADWVKPLAAHAFVHGTLTFFIAWVARGNIGLAVALAVFDFAVHFVVDRVKASPKLAGRWKPLTGTQYVAMQDAVTGANGALYPVAEAQKRLRDNKLFWWALGLDQMAHHLTHYAIIAVLVCR